MARAATNTCFRAPTPRLEDPFADEWTPAPDHPVTALLAAPSRRMPDPRLFWESLFRALFASGNAYAWIRRDPRTRRPVELVPAACRVTRWAPGAGGPV